MKRQVRRTEISRKVTQGTLKECREYWRRRGIAPGELPGLSVELESHMAGAAADGKSLEESIRSPRDWAADQARDLTPRRSVLEHTSAWVAILLTTSSVVLLSLHLAQTSFTITVHSGNVLLVVILAIVARALSSAALPFVVFNPFERKGIFTYGDYIEASAGVIVGVAVFAVQSVMLDTSAVTDWRWGYTVLVGCSAVALHLVPRAVRSLRRRAGSSTRVTRLRCPRFRDRDPLSRSAKCDRLATRISLVSVLFVAFGWLLTLPDPSGFASVLLAAGAALTLFCVLDAANLHRVMPRR